jgi:uncharacterized membrane protein YhhN
VKLEIVTIRHEIMSFNLGLDNVKQLLVMLLMVVFVFAVMFTNLAFEYKIGIAVLVFSIIFMTSLADQAGKQEEERAKARKY